MDNKWNKCEDVMPPLNEEVLILYKDKADELKPDNLFYGLSKRCKDTKCVQSVNVREKMICLQGGIIVLIVGVGCKR